MFTKEYGNGPMLIRHANFFPMLHLLLPIPKLETRFDVPLKMPLESLLQLGLGRPRRVKDHYAIKIQVRRVKISGTRFGDNESSFRRSRGWV
jgi:hypothetical protein